MILSVLLRIAEMIIEFVLSIGVYYTLTFLGNYWDWLDPMKIQLLTLVFAIIFANQFEINHIPFERGE